MSLQDKVKQLMYYRDKIKEYKILEDKSRLEIIEFLKNHNQDGVIFKHNKKNVTLMVESSNLKKSVSQKEKQRKVQSILHNAGIRDVDNTMAAILESMKSLTVVDNVSKDKLKVKMTK